MPFSEKQRKMACADLGRIRKGQKTRTGMSEDQLRDFCSGPVKKARKGGKVKVKFRGY